MKDCTQIKMHRPLSRDGIYTIYPDLKNKKTVFCDMYTDGGGWTVSQAFDCNSENILLLIRF